MKISCQSCAAKYTIADAKVSGRIVKIKCKKCASTIVVNGNELVTGGMAAAPASAPMPSLHEIPAGLGALGSPGAGAGAGAGDDADTRVMAEAAAGDAPTDEWTVSITDDDQRAMTTEQVVSEYANGSLNQDTYLWRDGMADWLPLFDVPELQPLLAAAAGDAPPSSSAPMSDPGAPIAAGQSPFDVPAAGADLFGAGPASASQPPASGDARHVGERNENSVLFSLSSLTAAEDAASRDVSSASPSRPPGARSSGIDISGPPRPSNGRSENKKAGLDDIMNIGGGAIGASAMLAPPDLLAPVKEPEPPPPPPAPVSVAPGGMPISQAMPVSSPMMMPEQKKPMGLYIGLGAGGLLLLILVIVFATSGGDETQPVAENTSTESADKTGTGTGTAATDTTAKPDEGSSTDTSTDEEGDEEGDEEVEEPGEDATEDQKKAFLDAKKKAAAAGTEKPKVEDEPKKKKKKKKKVEDDGKPKGEFNRGAAMAALGGAAGAAQGCKKKGGPTGSGKARVTFAPSGRATSATVGGPFAGSSVGSCVAGIFRGASVPPFKGGAVTVSKSFRIK